MMRAPFRFNRNAVADEPSFPSPATRHLTFDPAAFADGAPSQALRGQFPQLQFSSLGGAWTSGSLKGADVLLVAVDGASPVDVDGLCINLRESGRADQVVICLTNADLATTRRLIREGAADVLPAPVSEPALAATLERIVGRLETAAPLPAAGGQVVSFLKAGGGVGSTAIAVQVAAILADNGRGPRVCVVDLDVQFGSAAMYLDVQDSITIGQVLSTHGELSEMGFASALRPHASGARILGAPAEFVPLDALTPSVVDALISALKRDFDIILLDLPTAWTAWTYRALRQSTRIVLVSQLTVPHAHLIRRQLNLIETQRLEDIPITLVCNRCGGDNPTGVSLRSVAGAVGRPFDVTVPDERKLMNEAINQGVALSTLRRGSKLEKALVQLGELIAPKAATAKPNRGN